MSALLFPGKAWSNRTTHSILVILISTSNHPCFTAAVNRWWSKSLLECLRQEQKVCLFVLWYPQICCFLREHTLFWRLLAILEAKSYFLLPSSSIESRVCNVLTKETRLFLLEFSFGVQGNKTLPNLTGLSPFPRGHWSYLQITSLPLSVWWSITRGPILYPYQAPLKRLMASTFPISCLWESGGIL